jgi:hypothetical protein
VGRTLLTDRADDCKSLIPQFAKTLSSGLNRSTLKVLGRKDTSVAQRDLRRVRSKARLVERAERELGEAIVQALAAGESYRDIAPYAGLSASRVHQIAQRIRGAER